MASDFYRGDKVLKPLKWYRELKTSQGRRDNGLFLMEGLRAIRQVLSSQPECIDELIISDTFSDAADFSAFRQRVVSKNQFGDIVNSVSPQGIAAVLRIPEGSYSSKLPDEPGRHIVLLEDVQDPGNVGTIIRTAAAFNFSGVLLTGQCADPFSPKVVQASAGALFSLWIRRNDDVLSSIRLLQQQGFALMCADIDGGREISFSTFDKVIIALGNEGAGLSEGLLELADVCYAIPMNSNSVESLNVAVSGAISLFAVYSQCGWKMP